MSQRPLKKGEVIALTAVVQRLTEWAEWYSREPGGLGYPSEAIEYRLLHGGRGQRFQGVTPHHAQAEEVEAWVKEMAQPYPLMARALRLYYFHPKPLRAQAVLLGVSHSQVALLLKKAHYWLAARWGIQRQSID